jgi:hypothetical protein
MVLGASASVLSLALVLTGPAAGAGSPPPDPRTGAIGLLQLPEVYGTEPCQRFRPAPVAVYAAPDWRGPPAGEIRVARYWTYPPEGGCAGLRVEFVPAPARDGAAAAEGVGAGGELPAQEYAAEQPAAIVLEQRADGFRLRLPAGSGWVRATPRNDFGPLLALLRRELDGFTDPAGATLHRLPADDAEIAWRGVPDCAIPRVRASETRDGRTWLEVQFERDACCADDAPRSPAAPVGGWLPLYREDGVPSVWFASRGC